MSANDSAMTRFLFAILQQKSLKDIDWNKVAHNPILAAEISNGHAARMRYSRFKTALLGLEPTPRKNKNKVAKNKSKRKHGSAGDEGDDGLPIKAEDQDVDVKREKVVKLEGGGGGQGPPPMTNAGPSNSHLCGGIFSTKIKTENRPQQSSIAPMDLGYPGVHSLPHQHHQPMQYTTKMQMAYHQPQYQHQGARLLTPSSDADGILLHGSHQQPQQLPYHPSTSSHPHPHSILAPSLPAVSTISPATSLLSSPAFEYAPSPHVENAPPPASSWPGSSQQSAGSAYTTNFDAAYYPPSSMEEQQQQQQRTGEENHAEEEVEVDTNNEVGGSRSVDRIKEENWIGRFSAV